MEKVAKENLEMVNTLSWLMMDATWMMNFLEFSYVLTIPTVLTGAYLIFLEDGLDGYLVACAALMWSLMNSLWLLGENLQIPGYLIVCKICFVIGVTLLLLGLSVTKDRAKMLQVFSRFKIKGIVKR